MKSKALQHDCCVDSNSLAPLWLSGVLTGLYERIAVLNVERNAFFQQLVDQPIGQELSWEGIRRNHLNEAPDKA